MSFLDLSRSYFHLNIIYVSCIKVLVVGYSLLVESGIQLIIKERKFLKCLLKMYTECNLKNLASSVQYNIIYNYLQSSKLPNKF